MDSPTKVPKLNVQYLDLCNQTPFIFVVGKKKYICNNFAVLSSKVIYDLRNKDPELNEYVYDFVDQNNDFQNICNFFNFQKVLITTKNMNSLLQIAEDLKIDIIINDINNFIDSYETIIQESELIDKIFGQIYNISMNTIKNTANSIIESVWAHSEDNIQELTAIFLQAVRVSYQIQPLLIDLLISLNESADETNDLHLLLPFVIKQLLLSFHKSRFFCSFLYKLMQRNFVSIDEIIDRICVVFPDFLDENKNEKKKKTYYNEYAYRSSQLSSDKTNIYQQKNVIIWFLPELFELKHFPIKQITENLNDLEKKFVRSYLPNNLENFKKMRDSGQPEDDLMQTIIIDDVDTFQFIISKRQIDVNQKLVLFNLFDEFDNNNSKSYIDYAAKYGAIKCFKYLLLNHAKISIYTYSYAVYGGNAEIIRIIDQNQSITPKTNTKSIYINDNNNQNYYNNPWMNQRINNKSQWDQNNDIKQLVYFYNSKFLDDPIIPSIMMHKYDLFDWILDQKVSKKEINDLYLIDLARIAVIHGNIHAFVRLIDNGLILNNIQSKILDFIHLSCNFGFYHFTKLLLSFSDASKNELIKIDDTMHSSIIFGNLSIFKLFYEENDLNYTYSNFESLFQIIIQRDYVNIYKYINEKLCKIDKKILLTNFISAIEWKSFSIIEYLESKINLNEFKTDQLYNSYGFDLLLNVACKSGYCKIVKNITEIIIAESPKFNLTKYFITAAKSGSEEICKYFIDKKVAYDTFDILQNYSTLDLGMGDVLFSLINNSDLESREKFSKIFLNEAIKKGNKKLVDLLLNKDSIDKQALFSAVKTHDIELVNKILNCQSKPSFVNQVSENGTALNIAVVGNDLAIAKRLLSIPGIDPNLYTKSKITPLMEAIIDMNIEMMNLLLEYYGDNIQKQLWQINSSLKIIIDKISKNQDKPIDNNMLIVIDKLINIKNIDLNFFYNNDSFLTLACKYNQICLVQILLKSDSIDVNAYEPINSNTPLIIAIYNHNIEIAKLLIGHPQININFKNNNLQTAFTIAINSNLNDLIPIFINNEKFDPEDNDIDYAFFISDASVSKELIKSKYIDVNYTLVHKPDKNKPYHSFITEKLFETSLMHAISQNIIEKVDLILQHPSFDPVKSQLKQIIFEVISMKNLELFKKLWKYLDNDINLSLPNGYCILKYAAIHGSLEIIREILYNSDFKDYQKTFCSSFVIVTHRFKSDEIIPILSEFIEYDTKHYHYIDFNQVLEDGETYLTSLPAYSLNIDQIAQFFLVHNSDPNLPNKNGIYPLEYAIQCDSFPFILTLLNSGKVDYSVRLKNNHETYLILAAKSINLNIMNEFTNRYLIDINLTDDLGKTALDYRKEIEDKYHKIADDIIEKTANTQLPISKEFIESHYNLLVEFLRDFDSLDEWDDSFISDFMDFLSDHSVLKSSFQCNDQCCINNSHPKPFRFCEVCKRCYCFVCFDDENYHPCIS